MLLPYLLTQVHGFDLVQGQVQMLGRMLNFRFKLLLMRIASLYWERKPLAVLKLKKDAPSKRPKLRLCRLNFVCQNRMVMSSS